MARRVVLASASPSRSRLLTLAGIEPEVIVSGVDEDGIGGLDPPAAVSTLAERKALAVAGALDGPSAIVIGGDSMLELGGEIHGKPGNGAEAAERWRRMRGGHGTLWSGHCVIDTATGRRAVAADGCVVHFADIGDDEIDAYVATGEPLRVAGAFTLDNFGAPFVDRIEGDPGTVIGISLPVVRRLLADLGIPITDLWTVPS